ncbi:hypothetical protein LJB89_04285, partial [Tyzzerella sp. OttesenSCG-928-J15]|nr:hypothetical protein [Tyzzerella sp. OttesenSCG-928-J15]
MDKNVKKLGALAVILIALVGVYIATLNMGEKVEAEPEIAVEKIIDKEKDAIVAFRLSNGSDIEFNLKDGRWVMAEHEDFRL